MLTPFWLDDPTVLFRREDIRQVWPTAGMTSNEKLNAITRLVIVLTVLGYLLSQTLKIVVTGIVTVAAIIVLRYAQHRHNDGHRETGKEGFLNPGLYPLDPGAFKPPEPSNPAMNLLLTQIADEPNRKPAAPAYNPEIADKMNKATQAFIASNFDAPKREIDDKLFKDLGDSYTFDQSMRNWYATPNTQVPNDQHAFAEYCYGNMISCKEGNPLACSRSMPPHWINGTN